MHYTIDQWDALHAWQRGIYLRGMVLTTAREAGEPAPTLPPLQEREADTTTDRIDGPRSIADELAGSGFTVNKGGAT